MLKLFFFLQDSLVSSQLVFVVFEKDEFWICKHAFCKFSCNIYKLKFPQFSLKKITINGENNDCSKYQTDSYFQVLNTSSKLNTHLVGENNVCPYYQIDHILLVRIVMIIIIVARSLSI
jgi:hypothetical protein